MGTSLKSQNVVVNGHRTSMRLEPEMWDALREISLRENMTVNQICTMVNKVRDRSSLTSAVRVFALAYFRSVAAEQDARLAIPDTPLSTALGLTQRQITGLRADHRPV